jgi:hypothetical protein
MKNLHASILLSMLLYSGNLFPQEDVFSEFGNLMVEILGEENENLEDAEERYEYLIEIYEQQENINLVSEDILQTLSFMTEYQAYSFLEYRKKYGKIYSIKELWLIPGFHADLIKKFSYLFDFDPNQVVLPSILTRKRKSQHKLLLRSKLEYPLRAGFTHKEDTLNAFHGSTMYRLVKYEFQMKDRLRAGITLESDAGEMIIFDSISRGFNFNSFYAEIQNTGILNKAIAGDFKMKSAEGLVYSNGRGGKSSENSFQRKLPELKKYSSTGETGFYRGIAAQAEYSGLRIISFLSESKNSGAIYRETDSTLYFRSLKTSGLYRNTREKFHFRNIKEKTGGIICTWTNDHFQAGYNFRISEYDPWLEYQEMGDPWTFPTREKHLFWQSIFYNLQSGRFLFSGEYARKKTSGFAYQQKISFFLHPLFSLNFSYRNFSPYYYCPGSSTFSESGNSRNEQGFYTGILAYPFPFLKVKAYLDLYKHPWIDYRSTFPVQGTDFLLDTEWYFHKQLDLRIYFKVENELNKDSDQESEIIKMSYATNYRFFTQFTWKISEYLSSRSRIEIKMHHFSVRKNSGSLLYQEFTRSLPAINSKINIRYSVFDIPDWSVRIYSWEHDLLYSFSSPSFYKAGYNFFLNFRCKITSFLNLGLKFSLTGYNSLRESGSSADFRESNNFYELKAQCIFKI